MFQFFIISLGLLPNFSISFFFHCSFFFSFFISLFLLPWFFCLYFIIHLLICLSTSLLFCLMFALLYFTISYSYCIYHKISRVQDCYEIYYIYYQFIYIESVALIYPYYIIYPLQLHTTYYYNGPTATFTLHTTLLCYILVQ